MFKKPCFYVVLGTFNVGNDFLISQTPSIKPRFRGGPPYFMKIKGCEYLAELLEVGISLGLIDSRIGNGCSLDLG